MYKRQARGSVAAAALIALGVASAAWSLNHYLASAIYPEGARSLSGQMASRHSWPAAISNTWIVPCTLCRRVAI